MGTDVSIVIPAFNEEHRLPATLAVLLCELPSVCPTAWEVVVSDDGSTDHTVDVVKELGGGKPVHLVSSSINLGKGAALLKGVVESLYDNVLMLDADLPVPVQTIAMMLGHAMARGSGVGKSPRTRRIC